MNHHTDVRFLQKEARAVDGLVTALADLGITCPEFLADAIEGETNLHEIVGNLIQADGELAAQIEALADYKKKIDERLKRMKAAKETLRERLHEALKLSQKDRIPTAFGTLHYTTGQPEAEITAEVDLPTIYFKRELDKGLVGAHAREFFKGFEALKATKSEEDFEALLTEMKLSPYHENWHRVYRETSQIEDEEERAQLLGIFEAENPPIPGVNIKPPVQSISIRRN